MKCKRILCSILAVGLIGSFCTLGAGAVSYRSKDMSKSWTESLRNDNFKCSYWPGSLFVDNSAQTSISVEYSHRNDSIAYVYLRGQNQSVGNEKNSSTYSGGWITTPRCYAKGKQASWTFHRYICGSVKDEVQFNAL